MEIHPENYIDRGGRYLQMLQTARRDWPVVTHGLTTCLGSVEPFDTGYLRNLRDFLREVDVPWHSEHLCLGTVGDRFFHDLLPIPFTEEAASVASQRLTEVRDAIDKPLALENVSYYAPQGTDGLAEADFVVEVLERADAKLLLDVNNIYVNSINHGYDPLGFLRRLPGERIVYAHVAGHYEEAPDLRVDTHGADVIDPVWELLERAYAAFGLFPTLLERDFNIPPLNELVGEVAGIAHVDGTSLAETDEHDRRGVDDGHCQDHDRHQDREERARGLRDIALEKRERRQRDGKGTNVSA